tara:strand:- start:330 stop:701 length:372 start_codon:yes stop_codon:yes gene_type:complete
MHLVLKAEKPDFADFANANSWCQIFSRGALCDIAVDVFTALGIGCLSLRTFLLLASRAEKTCRALLALLCTLTVKAIHACANSIHCLFKRAAALCLDFPGYKQVGGGILCENSKVVVRKRVWC